MHDLDLSLVTLGYHEFTPGMKREGAERLEFGASAALTRFTRFGSLGRLLSNCDHDWWRAPPPHNRSQRGFHTYEIMVGKHGARVLRALYSYSTLRVFYC
jgi:hypothetical protein